MEEPRSRDHPDALRAFLWGKRQSRRHSFALDVDVRGVFDEIAAMSIDISAAGVLLRVPTAALAPEAAQEGEVDPFLLVQTHLRGSCRAHFRKCDVTVHVEVVRLDVRVDEPDFVYVGCRFAHPLDREQLRRFALAPEECAPEPHGLPSEMMPLRAANDPCVCRLYEVAGSPAPVFEGEVLAIGGDTLCMRVEGHHATLAAVGLGGKELRVDVLEGDEVNWTTSAWLQTIGFPGDDLSELELGLLTDTPPGPNLRRRFHGVATAS